MSVTSNHTKEERDRALNELKTLLAGLGPETKSTSSDMLDSLHFKLLDDICSNTPQKPKKSTLYDYILHFTNTNVSHIFSSSLLEKAEADNLSVYEDDPGDTKTIYRSKSFDNSLDEILLEEPENKLNSPGSEDNDSSNKNHGFNLEEFSDTFNLSDIQQNNEQEVLNESIHTAKSLKREGVNVPKNIIPKPTTDSGENYPSVGSAGSFQFNEIMTGDILGELEGFEEEEVSNKSDVQNKSSYGSLDSDEDIIVNAIVLKLRKQLQPTLEKLSQESEKYELIKHLYRLPSISNLNDDIKIKYSNKGKKFNLDFDNDVIKELVDIEKVKNDKRKKTVDKCPVISAEDQVRLNFNKFRRLNTIEEDQDAENGFQKPEMSYPSSSSGYIKSKDSRSVQHIETDELVILLQRIKEGTLVDLGKVKHLVTMFEQEPVGAINRMDNDQLKSSILLELNKRKVI